MHPVGSQRGLVKAAQYQLFLTRVGVDIAFQLRSLRAPGAADFHNKNIHYRITETKELAGKDIIILGCGDSALDWALELHDKVNSLMLIHRRMDYRAQPGSVKKMKQLASAGALREFHGMVREVLSDEGKFRGLKVADPEGTTHEIDEIGRAHV